MEVKDQLTDEEFSKKSPEERDLILFKKLEEVSGQVACLCRSPWRLAVPAVKWASVAAIVIASICAGKTELAVSIAKILGGIG